jgi:hypothetical protein
VITLRFSVIWHLRACAAGGALSAIDDVIAQFELPAHTEPPVSRL